MESRKTNELTPDMIEFVKQFKPTTKSFAEEIEDAILPVGSR
jgi:hypothetical protein